MFRVDKGAVTAIRGNGAMEMFVINRPLRLYSRPVELNQAMTPIAVLWVYIVLLVAGGTVGFLKAQSKMSLLTSVGFAALLSLCALEIIRDPIVADIILVVLLIFFGMRVAKTKKFMPMGMMTLVTVIALTLRHFPR